MDIRDYMRMLKRGWPVVLLVGLLFVGLAAAYLRLTPKEYQATAVLLVSANAPKTVSDLALGSQFSTDSMATYAQIVDSSTVLSLVAAQLRPQRNVDDLVNAVSATVRTGTRLIDVTATGHSAPDVASIAQAAAQSAARVIPALENSDGPSLTRMELIRPAVEPTQPVSPNDQRVLALGFIVGLLIGLAGTIAVQALDTRIRRVHDLRMLTRAPLLAALPRVKRAQRHGLLARDDPAGPFGEAFRTLRTNVRFAESRGRRSLVVTAVADDGDGARVPVNLAWMLAEVGHRVLLVDLDLRQSRVGAALGIDGGAGMTEALGGTAALAEVTRVTGHPNLEAITSGIAPSNPSELLSAPSLSRLLKIMESKYQYVILHAPPLLSYSDAAVLSSSAAGTLVVVTAGRTRAQELSTAMTVLANVGVTPLGVVMTRVGNSAVDLKNTRGARPKKGRTMRHRLDWDWRSADSKVPPEQPNRTGA